MAEQIYNVKCGFFDAVNNDRVYTAEDMNRLYKRVIHDGVFPNENNNPSEDFLVEADSGMTIIVKTGEGVFASHWFKNSIDIPIDVPPNSSNDRIDSIIIQVDTRKSGRAGNVVYRTGEPASSPVPPEINRVSGVTEYRLANISVTSGATAITSADITDLRGTSECPWVTGIVSANDIPPNSVTEAKLATNAVTTAKIKNGAVTGSKIAAGTIETTNIGAEQVKTANIDDGAVTGTKIAAGTIQSSNIGIGQVQESNIDGGAVTENKLDTNSVTSTKIKDGAVTVGKLGVEAVQEINIDQKAVTTSRIDDEAVTYEKLDAYSLLNTSTTSQPIYDDRHLPTAQFMKDYVTNRLCGNYSIGFNVEGMAVKKTINKTLNIGEFGAETLKVYVSSQVTRIGANFFTTATNVTDIYIDNVEGEVELPTIPEGVTIHYKDEFKLSDLLIDSMVASNNEILAMRATVNEVNTTLENAINGVSE